MLFENGIHLILYSVRELDGCDLMLFENGIHYWIHNPLLHTMLRSH